MPSALEISKTQGFRNFAVDLPHIHISQSRDTSSGYVKSNVPSIIASRWKLENDMQARVRTVAFHGIDVMAIDVQVQIALGPANAFAVVGLPDKAVGESRERVRAALTALGIALPAKRIIVNLSPADVAKEGSHYDLPIALGLLTALGVVDARTHRRLRGAWRAGAGRRPHPGGRRAACRLACRAARTGDHLSRDLRRRGGLGWFRLDCRAIRWWRRPIFWR